jgi:hypothetical protein
MKIPSTESLKSAVACSLAKLVHHDGMLFEAPIEEHAQYDARKLHEVCINHKLAQYLAAEILPLIDNRENLFVDIEFNREGVDFKDVQIGDRIERVRPDIIIHNRRSNAAKLNLLIVECKKSGCSAEEIDHDRDKITALMSDKRYAYYFGLQIIYAGPMTRGTLFYKNGTNIRTTDVMQQVGKP